MASYLGGYLKENCPALEDRRNEEALKKDWVIKGAQYAAWQAAQEQEIAEDGEVKTFLVPEIY